MNGIIVAVSLLCIGLTNGYSRFKYEIPNGHNVSHPCRGRGYWGAVGHMSPGYTPQKNVFGQDFRANEKVWTVEFCRKDSDGDGISNGAELGDPDCTWRRGVRLQTHPIGHPGFCEQDRRQCNSGMTHPECPNPHARGNQRRRPQKQLPPGANDHPQTFLSKNLVQNQNMGQGIPPFGMGTDSGRGRGMQGGSFDQFGGLGGQPRDQSGRFSSEQSFFPSGFDSSANTRGFQQQPGLSQDFGVSSGGFMGSSDMGRAPGSRTMSRGFSFDQPQQTDRFRSSLDQRQIQGMGSPGAGPSFASSLSQMDIERSVQSRLQRERSRSGGGGGSVGFGGMGSGDMTPGRISSMGMDSIGMGPMGSGGMRSGGMGSMRPESMGPSSQGFMGQMSRGMGSMGSGGPGFSGGMEGYPPFMRQESSFTGGMSMPGGSGMFREPGFSRF